MLSAAPRRPTCWRTTQRSAATTATAWRPSSCPARRPRCRRASRTGPSRCARPTCTPCTTRHGAGTTLRSVLSWLRPRRATSWCTPWCGAWQLSPTPPHPAVALCGPGAPEAQTPASIFLLVLQTILVSTCRSLLCAQEGAARQPAAYVHYRWEEEAGAPVLYCYEIQLEPRVQRKGLGGCAALGGRARRPRACPARMLRPRPASADGCMALAGYRTRCWGLPHATLPRLSTRAAASRRA